MANAPRDDNRVPTLLGVSSADFTTPTTVAVDPTTHSMLVDVAVSISPDINIAKFGNTSVTIGQKAMTASLPVTLASDQSSIPVTLTSTTITGTVAATQSGTWNVGTTSSSVNVGQTTSNSSAQRLNGGSSIPSTNGILVQALAANTNNVYVGGSGVTSGNGYELQPGQAVPFTTSDINNLYVIGGTGSDKVCWNVL